MFNSLPMFLKKCPILKRLYVGQSEAPQNILEIITHMWRRWGTPQNFCLSFIDELEKQLFIKKLLKWANKKCKNLNIYNVVLKKIKKNTWRYHYFTPVNQKS